MPISKSPLCMHVEQGSGNGYLRTLPVKPKAVKTFNASTCRDVKGVDPAIITVMRRYVDNWGPYLNEGQAGGMRFVDEIGDLAGVDILEDLNEATGFHDPDTLMAHNQFSLGFIRAAVSRGVKPCILNAAVGCPDPAIAYLLKDCVQLVGLVGGYVGIHGYGPRTILEAEAYYANNGPLRLVPVWRNANVNGPIRFLYTEAGWDKIESYEQPWGPWRDLNRRGLLPLDDMYNQLNGYCHRLDQLGVSLAFLFTWWGTDEWVDYEYSNSPEFRDWYREHLMIYQPVASVPSPLPSVMYVTAQPRVNLRSEPSTTARDIGNVYYRHAVKPLEKRDNWYRVGFSGKDIDGIVHDVEGWIVGEWLSTTKPI